ncbi:hypothetical protein FHS43_000807 [Streptosporangium becharense]|uniref:Uncharacterized protein n=1 Tax=Streptosporangium becharense TaxID=1816182 RepID=A0A7W9IF35_9ACTN|nr:hypothetical protein [Streptosporangium becharense]MBB2909561.1 hypothetical protein [Streptosporangium becharense]MBB5819483.1 hypothetical protein [Streptosporangium becharense]
MKRMIAVLTSATAVALTASLPVAAHASAQAPDPLTALKKQLTAGHGVQFVDTVKTRKAGRTEVISKREGELQFDAAGISASDHTSRPRVKESDLEFDLSSPESGFGDAEDDRSPEAVQAEEQLDKLLKGLADPERVVRVKKAAYLSGGVFGPFLPVGKPWLHIPEDTLGVTGSIGQHINPAEPATLKALLANATVKRPTSYAGKITFGELHKVSPWFRAAMGRKLYGDMAKDTLNWKLFLGTDRLPARLTTTETDSSGKTVGLTVDTRYTGWGSEVSITAPADDQIATMKELEDRFLSDNPIPLVTVK